MTIARRRTMADNDGGRRRPASCRSPARGWIALSPLNRRRWQNFKANRRGYWSLWIFLVLFVVSLFAEFIANDQPFCIHVRRPSVLPGLRHLSRDHLRRRSSRPPPTTAIHTCRS